LKIRKKLLEDILKKFYKDKKELERLKHKLSTLERHESEVQKEASENGKSLKTDIDENILNVKSEIRALERFVLDFEFVMNSIDEDYRAFIKLRYGEKRSNTYISIELNISEASVGRLRNKVLQELEEWLRDL